MEKSATVVSFTLQTYPVEYPISDWLAGCQTPAEQSVYHRLYRLSHGNGGPLTEPIGFTRLARSCHMSWRTVQTAINRLIQKGHIQVERVYNSRMAKGTVYRVFKAGEIYEWYYPRK